MNLVLDTNVVIDWLVFDDPFLKGFRDQVRAGEVTVFTHQPAIDELTRVLGYRELELDAQRQREVLARYLAQTSRVPAADESDTVLVELPMRFPRCRDPDDDQFLALAWHARADALVSRDHALLKLARRCRAFGFEVLNVPQMMAALVNPAAWKSDTARALQEAARLLAHQTVGGR